MAESIMLDKAKDFAVDIVNLCRNIKETKRETFNSRYQNIMDVLFGSF